MVNGNCLNRSIVFTILDPFDICIDSFNVGNTLQNVNESPKLLCDLRYACPVRCFVRIYTIGARKVLFQI